MASDYLWVGSGYLDAVFTPEEVIADARTHPSACGVEFDTLVGHGLSGALIIPVLAAQLDVKYMIVRKPADGSHEGSLAEGFLGARWLFVDDFIAEGTTFRAVYQRVHALARHHRFSTELVGGYFYQPGMRRPGEEFLRAFTLLARHQRHKPLSGQQRRPTRSPSA